jgi:hypothetical protein
MINLVLFTGQSKIVDTYPKKQLYTGGTVVRSKGTQRPQAETNIDLLFIAQKLATATKTLQKVKGGTYEGEDSDRQSYQNKSRRGNGKHGGGKPKSGDPTFNAANNPGQSGLRGYQTQPGTICIVWNSGIKSGLTVNTRITTKDYTALYLSSGWLFKVTDPQIDDDTPFNKQLNEIIWPLIEASISNRINRCAGQFVKVGMFNKYVDYITEALQLYYCIDNVLTYGSNITLDNVNVGMEGLRAQLSAEAIVSFNLLKEYLCTCPVPPNLLEYIRFMCQSYRTSEAPHASIIKLNIGGMFDSNWDISTSSNIEVYLNMARTHLIECNPIVSYLNQTFPSWMIVDLPDSANVACYDENFLTFWHNQNCCYLSTDNTNLGNFEYTQIVKSEDSYTDYQIIQKDDEVDGVIFVSNSYNIREVGKDKMTSFWGVWQPLATITGKKISAGNTSASFNIKCYDEFGRVTAALDSKVLGSSGIHWLVEYTGPPGKVIATRTQFGTHGFVKLQNSSARMQNEAFNNTMRLWFTS